MGRGPTALVMMAVVYLCFDGLNILSSSIVRDEKLDVFVGYFEEGKQVKELGKRTGGKPQPETWARSLILCKRTAALEWRALKNPGPTPLRHSRSDDR